VRDTNLGKQRADKMALAEEPEVKRLQRKAARAESIRAFQAKMQFADRPRVRGRLALDPSEVTLPLPVRTSATVAKGIGSSDTNWA
jgi:hypothetical protein